MVRVERSAAEELVEGSNAEPVVMRGRPMGGWLLVPVDELATERELRRWVGIATDRVRSLPPKHL